MISYGDNRCTVYLTYSYIGQDLLVIITGGDKHIGGISLTDTNGILSIKKEGHKEDIISKMVSPLIYEKTKKDTLVVCGIHLDNITKDEIDTIIKNVKVCVNKFLKEIDE